MVTPTITTQPKDENLDYASPAPTTTAMTVAASVEQTDGSELTYQWYKKAADAANFTAAGTGESLTPELPAIGKSDAYYCEVTNTYMGQTYTTKTNEVTVAYNKATLSKDLFTIGSTELPYTGEEQTLSITTSLAESEYQISGNKGTDAGDYTATVSATETGNYTGSFTQTWKITEATMTDVTENQSLTVYTTKAAATLPEFTATPVGSSNSVTVEYSIPAESQSIIEFTNNNTAIKCTETAAAGNTATVNVAIKADNNKTENRTITVTVSDKTDVKSKITFENTSTTSAVYNDSDKELSTFVNEATITGITAGTDAKWTYTIYKEDGTTVVASGAWGDAALKVQDAGTYKVTATYEDSINAGTTDALTFTITKAQITLDGSWSGDTTTTYDGESKSLTYNTNDEKLEVTATTYQKGSTTDAEHKTAGTYTVTATVAVKAAYAANYELASGTQPTTTLTINKATVDVPTAESSLKYTGSEQTGVDDPASGAVYTVTGNKQTNAGEYTAVASLGENAANYKWSGVEDTEKESADQEIKWSISKATLNSGLTASLNIRYNDTSDQSITSASVTAAASDVLTSPASLGTVTILDTTPTVSNTNSILADNSLAVSKGSVTYKLGSLTTAPAEEQNSATITVHFSSTNYTDSTFTLTVHAVAKENTTVTYTNPANATYTGSEITSYKTASVSLAGNSTEGNWKYAITKAGAAVTTIKDAGTYKITATYEDTDHIGTSSEVTFVVDPAVVSIDSATVAEKTYNGATDDAVIDSVSFNGVLGQDSLAKGEGKGYTVSTGTYASPNAGSQNVTYTVTLNNLNYTFANNQTYASGSATGTINPKSITISVESIEDVVFDGSEQQPTVTVKNGDAVLTKDTDYTVHYSENINVTDSATATITAKTDGNYTFATATQTFKITQAAAPESLTDSDVKVKYTNTTKQTVQIGTVPTDAGTVSYAVGTVTGDSILERTPTVSDSGVVSYQLTSGLVYENVKDATVTIPVTVTMQNYKSKTVNVTITLTDKDAVTVSADAIKKTYDGEKLTDAAITGTATSNGTKVEGTWTWVTDVASMINVNTYQAQVQFTPTDTTNYLTPDPVTITVTITKATPTGTPTYTKIETSGKTLADAKLDVGTITPEGTITWDDGEDTKVTANKAYKWTFTPTDTDNYETLTGEITPYVYTYVYEGSSSATARTVTTPKDTENGTVTTDVSRAKAGDTVTITATPDEGYEVESVRVYDADGNRVTVTDNGDGTYSFTMPKRAVTIDAAFTEAAAETETPATFTDVPAGQWYSDAVAEVVERGLFNGYPDGTFQPTGTMTRAMLVTVLWRLDGSDDSFSANRFSDVVAGQWYSTAVDWASNWGIVKGVADDIFGVNENITREQLVTILYRYCQMKGYDVSETAALTGFADADSVSDYASEAMAWAVGAGIIQGYNHALDPTGSATRAQVATILMRFAEKFEA
jgi:hypothetical protein